MRKPTDGVTGTATAGQAASAALEVRDPADQRCVVAEVPAMGPDDVAAAYEQARAGFAAWRRANPLDRAAVLSAAADLIRFGGFRDSGSAFKEQGAAGLRFYTRLKTAAVRFAW